MNLRVLVLMATLLTPGLRPAFAIEGTGAAARAGALSPIVVQLAWKFQFEFAPFLVAMEKGYYRDAGLDVQVLEWAPGIDPVTDVVTGKADFGLYASSLVLERAKGQPVVAVAVLMQHSPVALLARRNAGITTALDLAGKRIALTPNTADEILAYLATNGLTEQRFTRLQRKKFGIEELTEKTEDAIGIFVANEAFHIRGHEDEYRVFLPQSGGIDFFGNVLFTSERLLKAQPVHVAAFRAATLKGLDYALTHQEEVVELILAKFNSQKKSREHLLFEAQRVGDLTRPDIVEPGYMSRRRWEHVITVYSEQMHRPVDVNLDDFLYDPTPRGLPHWLLWPLAGTLLALTLVLSVLWQVRRFNRRLQGEIAERTRAQAQLLNVNEELRRAMTQLVQAEKLASLGVLVAGVAHELNTPIGNVRMTASTLHDQVREVSAAVSTSGLKRSILDAFLKDASIETDLIERNIVRAGELVSSFKQVAVDQTSEQRRTFDLSQLLKEVVTTLAPSLSRSTHSLTLEVGADIEMDSYPGPFGQVLANFVNNSLLHGFAEREGGQIAISAHQEDSAVVIEYRDDGQGMSETVTAHAFDPFYTTRLGQGSSGLGLYIVHNIVTGVLGGTVMLDTAPGQGVRFILRLPQHAPPLRRNSDE